jgi:hypothetical protein
MDFHAGPAGIGENALDPFPFQGADQDVAARHGLAEFRLGRLASFFADFCVHIILAGRPGPNKKPTTVASRGFLSKFALNATSLHGAAAYDGGHACQNNLQRTCLHERTISVLVIHGQGAS